MSKICTRCLYKVTDCDIDCVCGFYSDFFDNMRKFMISDNPTYVEDVYDQIYDAWTDFDTNAKRTEYIDKLYSAAKNGVILEEGILPISGIKKYAYVVNDATVYYPYMIIAHNDLNELERLIKLYKFDIIR